MEIGKTKCQCFTVLKCDKFWCERQWNSGAMCNGLNWKILQICFSVTRNWKFESKNLIQILDEKMTLKGARNVETYIIRMFQKRTISRFFWIPLAESISRVVLPLRPLPNNKELSSPFRDLKSFPTKTFRQNLPKIIFRFDRALIWILLPTKSELTKA